ncbi:MAG: MBL fold metallo-hydrolase [Treponema sp.]|jgi:glyoxylase-like metal-dependent hydrolase (beta-lactamase superfamily II)|nr:MBL fold metallo-hydrolase [Treponema sp.]
MKLFFHYSALGYSNCYILGSEQPPREAIIIDPSHMHEDILAFIEENDYQLKAILITHDHKNHVQGLSTMLRIYDTEIFAVNPVVMGQKTTLIQDGYALQVGSFLFDVISIPGHSADSVVFKCGRLLFTGDALSAGLIGRTASTYGDTTELTALRSKLLSLPGDFLVFPGHGPPSSLEAERRYNVGVLFSEEKRRRRSAFTVDLSLSL